jgi:hypothetical protein
MTALREETVRKRKALEEKFDCDDFCIEPRNAGGKHYMAEHYDIALHFFTRYGAIFPFESVVFHDAGNCFHSGDKNVFRESGMLGPFANKEMNGVDFVEFPSSIHQFLSVCDNGWFGPAKTKWRLMEKGRRVSRNRDAISSLRLYNELVNVKPEVIADAFDQNLFFGRKSAPRKKEIRDFLEEQKGGVYATDLVYEALWAFYSDEQAQQLFDLPWNTLVKKLTTNLDGEYWKQQEWSSKRAKSNNK